MKTLKRVLLVLVFFILMILFNQSYTSAVSVKDFLNNPTSYTGEELNNSILYIDNYSEDNWYYNYACIHQYATGGGNLRVKSVIDVTTNQDVTVYGTNGKMIVSESNDKQKFFDLAKKCYYRMTAGNTPSNENSDGGIATLFHNSIDIFKKYGVASVGSRPTYANGSVSIPSSLGEDIRILVTEFVGGDGRTR